jgi:hypothetical protein
MVSAGEEPAGEEPSEPVLHARVANLNLYLQHDHDNNMQIMIREPNEM